MQLQDKKNHDTDLLKFLNSIYKEIKGLIRCQKYVLYGTGNNKVYIRSIFRILE